MTNILATLLQLVLSLLLIVQNNPSISDNQKQQILAFANQTITAATQTIAQPVNQPASSSTPISIVPPPPVNPPTPIPPKPIICEYPIPPAGCTYVQGPNYDPTKNCDTVLSCPTPPVVQAPAISSLSPASGAIGAQVTISGLGFTPTGNKIKFGNLGSENNPSYSLNSSDGKTIVFTVPNSNYYACQASTPPCYPAVYLTPPGIYPVSVINANGTSGEVNFTVANPARKIICEYPAPPVGCSYIIGPQYDSTNNCGMVISCSPVSNPTW
jgi:hypothetical protein